MKSPVTGRVPVGLPGYGGGQRLRRGHGAVSGLIRSPWSFRMKEREKNEAVSNVWVRTNILIPIAERAERVRKVLLPAL